MRWTVHSTVLCFVIALGLARTPLAYGAAKDEAKKHFDRGIALIDDGQLQEALVEFQRSYDLTHHFAVLYNIGHVLATLARPVEAVEAYEKYLADGGKGVDATRQAGVRKEIARQQTRIATLAIHVLPAGASVRIDGKDVGKAPLATAVRVGVGTHVVSALAEGYTPADVSITVAGEDLREVEVALVPVVVPGPVSGPVPGVGTGVAATPPAQVESRTVAPAPAAASPRTGWLLGRTWTWVGAGATIVLAGGATTFSLLMRSKFDDLSSSCGKASAGRPGCSESDIDSVNTRKSIANALWGATGVAAVATAALFYFEGRGVAAAPMVGQVNGLSLKGRF
jgi:hypothetical protein